MHKNLLLIKASDDVCSIELNHITTTAAFFNIKTTVIEIRNSQSLEEISKLNIRFDYFYLCAHADHQGFGNNKDFEMAWTKFGASICETEIINEGCVFLLACCRSGLTRVAYDLFASCNLIEFVCGPRWSLTDKDLTVAFSVFLYNVEEKKLQPNHAADRMSQAVGYDFNCFDRIEVEMTHEYQIYRREFLRSLSNQLELELELKSMNNYDKEWATKS